MNVVLIFLCESVLFQLIYLTTQGKKNNVNFCKECNNLKHKFWWPFYIFALKMSIFKTNILNKVRIQQIQKIITRYDYQAVVLVWIRVVLYTHMIQWYCCNEPVLSSTSSGNFCVQIYKEVKWHLLLIRFWSVFAAFIGLHDSSMFILFYYLALKQNYMPVTSLCMQLYLSGERGKHQCDGSALPVPKKEKHWEGLNDIGPKWKMDDYKR